MLDKITIMDIVKFMTGLWLLKMIILWIIEISKD